MDSGGGIKGIDLQQAKLDKYEGNNKEANLNSQGKFSRFAVRKLANAASYLSRSHNVQVEQSKAQKTLNQFRITALGNDGDASRAAREVSESRVRNNEGGVLIVDDCPELEGHINELLKVADHRLARGDVGEKGYTDTDGEILAKGLGKTRHIVDTEKFTSLVERDLTTFLGNTIKSTNTPHGLEGLRKTVAKQLSQGHITEPHAQKLNQQITKQYARQLKNFPAYLEKLSPGEDASPEARHSAAREKLEAVHEMTIAVHKHSPRTLEKFHHQLKELALESFAECAESTTPHPTDLRETKKLQTRMEHERNQLLKAVLLKTSGGVEGRLEQADRSSEAARAALKAQLDEIPELERSMQKTVTDAVALMRQTKKQETAQATQERQLDTLKSELETRRKKAGSLRRINPLYQHFRTKNLKAQNRLRAELTATKNDIELKRQDYSGLQEKYAGEKQSLEEKRALYGESTRVLTPTPPMAGATFDIKPFTETLESGSLSPLDEACLDYHLNTFADAGVSPDELTSMAGEYVERAGKEDPSPRDVLVSQFNRAHIISQPSSLTEEPVSNIPPPLCWY